MLFIYLGFWWWWSVSWNYGSTVSVRDGIWEEGEVECSSRSNGWTGTHQVWWPSATRYTQKQNYTFKVYWSRGKQIKADDDDPELARPDEEKMKEVYVDGN